MFENKLKLFLHIGQPKTGSSAIQAFLNYNRENLVKKHHVLYPNFKGSDFGKGFQHNHEKVFLNAKLNNDYSGCIETFKKCKIYCENNEINKLILSNEGFDWYWWPELIKQILETLDCDFKIILYLRRQDHWIESAWKQWGFKNREYNSIQEFSKKINMDWKLSLFHWLNVFKADDFIVRPFEKSLIGENVVFDFLNIIGIYDKSGFIEPPPNNLNKNAGFNREIIEILNLCSKQSHDINDNSLLDFLFERLPESYKKQDPFEPYGLLSPTERWEIVDTYESSNNDIAKLFFGNQREALFLEQLPNLHEEWEPFEGLTIEKIVPVFMDILLNMSKQISALKALIKVDAVEPFLQENSYSYTEIQFESLLKKIEFSNDVTDIKVSESNLSFTSVGSDPFFILPNSVIIKNIKAIKIEMTFREDTILQIYYKSGIFQSFAESNSIRKQLEPGKTTSIIVLSCCNNISRLRIDPGCHPGKYIIHRVEIGF